MALNKNGTRTTDNRIVNGHADSSNTARSTTCGMPHKKMLRHDSHEFDKNGTRKLDKRTSQQIPEELCNNKRAEGKNTTHATNSNLLCYNCAPTSLKLPPAELVCPAQRYPHVYAWGFLLNYEAMERNKPQLSEEDSKDPRKVQRNTMEYAYKLFSALIRGAHNIQLGPATQVASQFVFHKGYGARSAISIVVATRPDDSLVPTPRKVEKLKKFFAKHEITEEPRWFSVIQD
ncbi:hypothetical protein BYT27DRAFT_7241144 [Phlegmacium glaucopus]|nr:hypothetical protein BYT27DRAFT_7241144 [Phlegmacium glaucopus]